MIATPGSSLPSSSSSDAPPPVEIHEMLVGHARIVHRAHRVASPDDGKSVATRRPRGRSRTCPRRTRATRRRPSARSRRLSSRRCDPPREVVARPRARYRDRASRRAARRTAPPCLGVRRELGRGDDVARQHHVERERVLVVHVLGHLPADQNLVGPRRRGSAARRPCRRPSPRPRRSRTAARPRRAARRGSRARRAAAALRTAGSSSATPRSTNARDGPSRTRRSTYRSQPSASSRAKPWSFFVSPGLKRVFSSTVIRSSGSSSATAARTGSIE